MTYFLKFGARTFLQVNSYLLRKTLQAGSNIGTQLHISFISSNDSYI